MTYIYLLAAILVSVHVSTYGLWVKRQGNIGGAIFIFGLIIACIGLPVYRILTRP